MGNPGTEQPAPAPAPAADDNDWWPDPDSWTEDEYQRALMAAESPKLSEDKRHRLTMATEYFDAKPRLLQMRSPSPEPLTFRGIMGVKPKAKPAPAAAAAPPPPAMVDTISERAPDPSMWESFIEGVTNPFELGDEMMGRGAQVAAATQGDKTNMPGRSYGQGMGAPLDPRSEYEVARDRKRAMQDMAARVEPAAYHGGQLATETAALAPLMFTPVGAARGASMVTRGLQSMPLGTAIGGATGYGASTAEADTWDEFVNGGQLRDTAVGSAFGGLTSAVGGELVHQTMTAAPRVAGGIRRHVARREGERIAAAHGPEAAERALAAADPDSMAGRETRQLVLAGESPDAMDAHSRKIFEELQRLGPPEDRRALARRANDPATLDSHAQAVTDDMSEIARHQDVIQDNETIGKKRDIAQAYFTRDQIDPLTAVQNADQIASEVRQSVQEMLSQTTPGTEENRLLRRIEPYLEEYNMPRMGGGDGPYDEAANKWAQLDQLKRDLQKKLKDVKFNAIEVEKLHGIEEMIRTELERPDLWGQGAADMQVNRNRKWHRLLSLEQTRDLNPRREFMTDYRGLPSASEHSYRSLAEGDLGSIKSTMAGATELEGEPAMWKLGEDAQRKAELGDALTDHIMSTPDMRGRAATMAQRAQAIRDRLGVRANEAGAARELSRMPGPVQDPSGGASRLLRTAEQELPDPELETFKLWAQGQGKDTSAIDSTIAQRAREAQAVEGLNAGERNLPDPPLLDRAMTRIANAGMSVPGVSGVANQAVQAMQPQVRTLGQRARVIAQLEQALQSDPGNKAAREALQRMRMPDTTVSGGKGAFEAFVAQNGALAGGDIAQSRGHRNEDAVVELLRSNPAALGQYAQPLKAAYMKGSLGAALYKLEADPQWSAMKAQLTAR